MKIHKAALAMPEMSPEDFATLKADINKHGLLCPIELLGKQIIDGRHRFKACNELDDVEARFVEVTLNGQTPEEYVWSVNAERRHLTAGQRAAVGVALWPAEKEKAKQRRKETQGRPKKGSKKTVGKITGSIESRDAVGQRVGVSGSSISTAAKVQEQSPAVFEELKQGKITLAAAKRKANPKRPQRKEQYPISTGIMKLLNDMVATSNMVRKQYDGNFGKLVSHKQFDPDKRIPAAQLVESLSDTISTWRKQCNTITKTISGKSSTSTAKLKAGQPRAKK